jgi:hypothetical protein
MAMKHFCLSLEGCAGVEMMEKLTTRAQLEIEQNALLSLNLNAPTVNEK